MTVSPQYFQAVTEREMTPFYWPAMVGLQHNPRAMDIHNFLSYRMHKGLSRPVTLHATVLHATTPCSGRESSAWPTSSRDFWRPSKTLSSGIRTAKSKS
jgi:hypothetical protein